MPILLIGAVLIERVRPALRVCRSAPARTALGSVLTVAGIAMMVYRILEVCAWIFGRQRKMLPSC